MSMNAQKEEPLARSFFAKHAVLIRVALVVLFAGCCAISIASHMYFARYNQRFLQAFNEIHEGMPQAQAREAMRAFGHRTTGAGTPLGEFPGVREFDHYHTDLLIGRYLTTIVIGYQNDVVAMKGGHNADSVVRAEELQLPANFSVFTGRPSQVLFFMAFDILALYPASIPISALFVCIFSSLRTQSGTWPSLLAIWGFAGGSFIVGSVCSPVVLVIANTIETFLAP